MPAALVATTASYPIWFIVVLILGAGGFGAAIWAVVAKGWKAFRGVNEILSVLRGSPGGDGTRMIAPLVDMVDGMKTTLDGVVSEQGHMKASMGQFKVDLQAVKDEVTANGGNSNSLGDRVVRLERAQRPRGAATR